MAQETQISVKIRPAIFPDDKEIVASLFRAYAASIPVKLDFQGFEEELAGLPSKYAVEKGGAVYLAYLEDDAIPSTTSRSSPSTSQQPYAIGCIALRPFPSTASPPTPQCELKRLYLAPEARGQGVSKLLMDVVIAQAKQLGYSEMLLDTLDSMTAARRLYEGYGFEEIEAYYESVEGAVFYRLIL